MSEHLTDHDETAPIPAAGLGVDPAEVVDPTEAVEVIPVDDDALVVDGIGRTITEQSHTPKQQAKISRREHDAAVRHESVREILLHTAPTVRTRKEHFAERMSGPTEAEKNLAAAIARGDTSPEGLARLQAMADAEVAGREQRHREFLARVRDSQSINSNLRPVTRRERRFRANAESGRRKIGTLGSNVMYGIELAFGDKVGMKKVQKDVINPLTGEVVLGADGQPKKETVYVPILAPSNGEADPGDGSSIVGSHSRPSRHEIKKIVKERNTVVENGVKRLLRTRKAIGEEVDATVRYLDAQLEVQRLEEKRQLALSGAKAKATNLKATTGHTTTRLVEDSPEDTAAETTKESDESIKILRDGVREFLFYEPYIDKAAIEALSPEQRQELEKSDQAVKLVGLIAPPEALSGLSEEERKQLYLTVELRLKALEAADKKTMQERENSIIEHLAAKPPESLTNEELETLKSKAPQRYLDALKQIDPKYYMEILPIMDEPRFLLEVFNEEIAKGNGPGHFSYDQAKRRLEQVASPSRLIEFYRQLLDAEIAKGFGEGDPSYDVAKQRYEQLLPRKKRSRGEDYDDFDDEPRTETRRRTHRIKLLPLEKIDPKYQSFLSPEAIKAEDLETYNALSKLAHDYKTDKAIAHIPKETWTPMRKKKVTEIRDAYVARVFGDKGVPSGIRDQLDRRLDLAFLEREILANNPDDFKVYEAVIDNGKNRMTVTILGLARVDEQGLSFYFAKDSIGEISTISEDLIVEEVKEFRAPGQYL